MKNVQTTYKSAMYETYASFFFKTARGVELTKHTLVEFGRQTFQNTGGKLHFNA